MKGTKLRVVRRNERKNESESRTLPAPTRKCLPLHLLEREEERIPMKKKIWIVHQKDQEAEAKPHHRHQLPDRIRKKNLEWLNAKKGRHLTVADLERGHLPRGQVGNERGIDLLSVGLLQRSKGHPRGAILLLLPLLGDSEVGWKRSEIIKHHAANAREATREEERGKVKKEDKGGNLHHTMNS
jgi:hypothetical protein